MAVIFRILFNLHTDISFEVCNFDSQVRFSTAFTSSFLCWQVVMYIITQVIHYTCQILSTDALYVKIKSSSSIVLMSNFYSKVK